VAKPVIRQSKMRVGTRTARAARSSKTLKV